MKKFAINSWMLDLKFGLLTGIAVVGSVAITTTAMAADSSRPNTDWSGGYVGGHFGYGAGSFGLDTNPILAQAVFLPSTLTGFVGGLQAGYNFRLLDNIVFGLEADMSFSSPIDKPATGLSPFNTTFDYFGTARFRIGYTFDKTFPFISGGLAWGQTRENSNDSYGNVISSRSAFHVGWAVGAGLEYALTDRWTTKIEYNYIDLGPKAYNLDSAVQPVLTVDPRIHVVKFGLNYRLGELSPTTGAPILKKSTIPESDDWSIHGQTTYIWQGYPRFRASYEGANSLPGGGQGRETWTATAFIGKRLWEGGEIYFNPELAQGFGLANTLGLGGFSNGEAQKAGAEFPRIRAQRYFLRQTFGLGGEQEAVEDGPNQLAGKRDIDRITLTVGRFAIGDIFDANTYAHDPRADFMNWAIWSSGAYDFPADLPGFTRGAVVELNRKNWALRAGWFQVPEEPNSDVLTFKTGGTIVEFETRYALWDQPGKLRLGAFTNRGRTGNYTEAVAIASANPSTDINTVMASIRSQRSKSGVYVNAEQAISNDVGIFARASWNDGQTEILSFTDIDRSVSAGVSIKGRAWSRPNDTFGFSGAINGLSTAHRDFLAAGGLGLLIGDGTLNYREEKILETFYMIGIANWLKFTVDYQFITNPAYNADRGPVHIFASRLHAEF